MDSELIPAGYQFFVNTLRQSVLPHFRQSYISLKGIGSIEKQHGIEIHIYPKSFLPQKTLASQLEFALKYDGVNLEILRAIFVETSIDEMVELAQSQPTGKYIRKIWFLYEFLLERRLPLDDLKMGNYIDLLPEDAYFTADAVKCSRQRINNNLLGNTHFCPLARKTDRINQLINLKLHEKASDIIEKYPSDIVHRASQFLYLKETKSSFAIEREQPTLKRTVRFVQALQEIEHLSEITKATLIELQNIIVEERFADKDYRQTQNYVGQSLPGYREIIHFISPQPQDLNMLMNGFLELTHRMQTSNIDSIATAAVCAFAFVYLHPFEDGNGRLHRLLIHYLLTRTGFSPAGIIFPVSAVMLAQPKAYDACLESFSRPLLSRVLYKLSDEGVLTVPNETVCFYQYFDATRMVEYLYETLQKTIECDLVEELDFILKYDRSKIAIQDVVDMPDKKIDLFIKISLDNKGKLSKAKKVKFFDFLSNDEVLKIEQIITDIFFNAPSNQSKNEQEH